jgi:hypothetical protein
MLIAIPIMFIGKAATSPTIIAEYPQFSPPVSMRGG